MVCCSRIPLCLHSNIFESFFEFLRTKTPLETIAVLSLAPASFLRGFAACIIIMDNNGTRNNVTLRLVPAYSSVNPIIAFGGTETHFFPRSV